MPKVRVILSMHPDRPVEVDRDELPGLRSQGILLEVEGETASGQLPAADGDGDGKGGSDGESGSAPDAAPAAGRRGKGSAAQ